MVGGAGLLGIVGLGAVGGILANIALTPLTAGASLLQSYWYGSGLILGERMMYTVHWEQIKGRLDKGEDFLSVLDKIMNDDITAIANLSFKAMDVTGKLYIDKAGESLASLIEVALTAIVTPFPAVTVETEPAPPGESTPTGISLTISEINSMSFQTLSFETSGGQIGKYTEATQAHMLTRLAELKITNQDTGEIQDVLDATITRLIQAEASFLSVLTNTTLATIYSQFIPAMSSGDQSIVVAKLRDNALFGVTSTRRKSSGSNANLIKYQNALASLRSQWNTLKANLQNSLSGGDTPTNIAQVEKAVQEYQVRINAQHVLIWTHQLIYI